MDKDRMEGKMKDLKGRVKRQVGEWTGDSESQAEGTADQAEGKIQNAFGNVKDKVRDITDRTDNEADRAADDVEDKGRRSA
jgi:uncharacterized protein YjbJ (UPF0337 family)